jgi:hypothetical protein
MFKLLNTYELFIIVDTKTFDLLILHELKIDLTLNSLTRVTPKLSLNSKN